MEVHLTPETESRLRALAAESGRAPDALVEDAMTAYLLELAEARTMLDSRYDELKSGHLKPMDGEEAFRRLREKSASQKDRPIGNS